ncbi:inositol monophosphatase family protein [Nonomuraea cavernae]|nr:inositol monophosphatase family protein [Nonomuraea cavernae]MCA2187372.1 hypothetical protein [Nonomuraea cavernae]
MIGRHAQQQPWDTAAGVIIAREAGATVVDLDGSPHNMTVRSNRMALG